MVNTYRIKWKIILKNTIYCVLQNKNKHKRKNCKCSKRASIIKQYNNNDLQNIF